MRDRPTLTPDDVQAVMSACRQEAEHQGWKVTIAIVDDGGHLLHLERLGARVTTLDVAIRKARTAALMQQPSGALEARVKDNPALLALDAMPLAGGLPLTWHGECVGGVGVSGVRPEQDEQVARAGCARLGGA
jgi:glc operon protein GlcG